MRVTEWSGSVAALVSDIRLGARPSAELHRVVGSRALPDMARTRAPGTQASAPAKENGRWPPILYSLCRVELIYLYSLREAQRSSVEFV